MNACSNISNQMQPGECVVICEGVMRGVRGTVLGIEDRCVVLSVLLLEGPTITYIDVDAVTSEAEFKAIPFLLH